MICYERKNKISKERRFNNAHRELDIFLSKFYVEDKNGFVLSADLEKDFQEYLWVKDDFGIRWIAPRLEMIFPYSKRSTQNVMINGKIRRRRGFKGFRLKDKEEIERILDKDWEDAKKAAYTPRN